MRRPVTWFDGVASLVGVAMAVSFLARGYDELSTFATTMAIAVGISALVEPALTFVHELGHALAAVALTPQRVMLYVGYGSDPVRLSIGRIDMRLSLTRPKGPAGHVELLPRGLPRWRMFCIAVAGPAASAVAAISLAFVLLAFTTFAGIRFWTILLSTLVAVLGVANLVPRTFRYQRLPGRPLIDGMTDGLIALHVLRGEEWVSPSPKNGSGPAAAFGPAARDALRKAFAITDPRARLDAAAMLAVLRCEPRGGTDELLAAHGFPLRPLVECGNAQRQATAALDHMCANAPLFRCLDGSALVHPLHLLLALLDDPTGETRHVLNATRVDHDALQQAALTRARTSTRESSSPPAAPQAH